MASLQTASTPRLTLPWLPLEDRTLPNGLRAIVLADATSPTVAINVAYRVGGKDDPPGRSGFAHLFEHLMFKGTPLAGAETIDRLTEDVGGYNNAFTADDLTNYYDVVPAHYLEPLLWAEADRLAHLAITAEGMATERDVVIGEYDQSVLSDPYGMLDELVNRKAFTVHPYRRGVIGNPDELRAATLEDVVAFHQAYYRPDNAILVVAGDLERDRAWEWIERYFGSIPRPQGAIERVSVEEPEQREARRLEYRAPRVPLPALEIAFRAPAAESADAIALDVLSTVLGTGRSARFYEDLVYRDQLASRISVDADLRADAGLFRINVVLAEGRTMEEARDAVEAQISRITSERVSEDELDKAKTLALTSLARSRQTPNGVALALVRAAIVRHDPQAANAEPDAIARVDAEDLLRVAREVFLPERATTIEYIAQ